MATWVELRFNMCLDLPALNSVKYQETDVKVDQLNLKILFTKQTVSL